MIEAIKAFFVDKILWLLAIPALIFVIYAVKAVWPAFPDDNPVEEAVEKVIQEKTGVDADLTPSSLEEIREIK